MRLTQILEASYHGNKSAKAVKFLQSAVQDEQDFLDSEEEDDGGDLVYALEEIIDEVKKGRIVSSDDIERVGDEVYNATLGSGSYGDTDLSQHIATELANLLGIKL